jgi:mannose-1-phosphate guanylyltransferase
MRTPPSNSLSPRARAALTADPRSAGETWVVILAGGEGRRIRSYTTSDEGVAVPKQYCRFRDERTLLSATLDRALQITAAERVLVMVLDAHRMWWERELGRLPSANVLSQPADRGTAIAVLQALVEIHCRDRDPLLVVMPSDSDVDEEEVLLGSIAVAQQTARMFPEDVILLGVTPSNLDCEYGLIIPTAGRAATARRVRAFVEKPPLTLARHLAQHGAMWNSFIFACEGWALYDVFEVALPVDTAEYVHGIARGFSPAEARAHTIAAMRPRDFGGDVLARSTARLRMVEVPHCGWTDLGTPARLASWLSRHRDAIFWREHHVPRLADGGSLSGAFHPA